jgi:hypothetical protein
MSKTPKIKRQWIKQEKQIVYLLYRKGLIIDAHIKLEDLYWASYNWLNRKHYKTKLNSYGGRIYRAPIYMPEVHFCTTDYWGESDEHSIVDTVLQQLYWKHVDTRDRDEDSDKYPVSTFPKMTRTQFIKYLKSLPTKVADKKINKIIKTLKDES